MAKNPTSSRAKAEKASKLHPKEFKTMENSLWCNLCKVFVSCEKKFNYESHRKSEKHTKALQNLTPPPGQQLIANYSSDNEESWHYKVTKAFMASNIPLSKMTKEPLNKLFKDIGHPLPSESKCRKTVETISTNLLDEIRQKFVDQKVFLVTDESDIRGQKYVNTLIGLVKDPTKTYLVECKPIQPSPTAQTMVTIIDDVLKSFSIERKNFLMLISDAAAYMVKAGQILKMLYEDCFHITCFAHLLHNCALRVKSFYSDVDNLIAAVKSLTVKNKTRKELFSDIGYPPVPIVTRWGSWLEAACFYAKNLPEVRNIVEAIPDDGIIVAKAKEALKCTTIGQSLMAIVRCYSELGNLVTKTESSKYTISDALADINAIDFGSDPCEIKQYLSNRFASNDMNKIEKMTNPHIAPQQYADLLLCQATSATVERSFSMLNKLLVKDRNFNPNNVHNYILLMYNENIQ